MDLFPEFDGVWNVVFTNKAKMKCTITSGYVQYGKRKAEIMQSDNQIQFPSSKGWFKISGLVRDGTWHYLRVKQDGTLEIHRFCSDLCKASYESLGQYCCIGIGLNKGMYESRCTACCCKPKVAS